MIAVGQKFDQQMISVDGGTFRDCEFNDCVLFFSGLLPVDLRGSRFNECRWEFVGPAANTIGFLHALHHRGETKLVDAVLDNIRHSEDGEHSH